MTRALSKAEAEALFKKSDTSTQTTSIPRRAEWPPDKDKALIYRAASNREDMVTLTDGRVFRIMYKKDNLIFIKPREGMVPCGYFRLRELKDEIGAWI